MHRRRFFAGFAAALAATLGANRNARSASPPMPSRLLLQESRLAGTHYYDAARVLTRLRPGDPLRLRAQPDNRHDPRAVEVFWREFKLGYLPRLDNAAVASLLGRSERIEAEIVALDDPREEWEVVRVRVWVGIST